MVCKTTPSTQNKVIKNFIISAYYSETLIGWKRVTWCSIKSDIAWTLLIIVTPMQYTNLFLETSVLYTIYQCIFRNIRGIQNKKKCLKIYIDLGLRPRFYTYICIYRSINPCIDLNGRLYLYNTLCWMTTFSSHWETLSISNVEPKWRLYRFKKMFDGQCTGQKSQMLPVSHENTYIIELKSHI